MSAIEWTDRTWNPIRGCSRVSSGCDNCYAMGQAHRFSGTGKPYEGLTTIRRGKVDWVGKARLHPEMLSQPRHWAKPQRIFVNSMSDLFHSSLSDEDIWEVFGVMMETHHTYQVLTKRPTRAIEWFRWFEATHLEPLDPDVRNLIKWPLPNVHLGVSVEDQKTADERIPLLLQCPVKVRFISAEPLLGPIDLNRVPYMDGTALTVGDEGGWEYVGSRRQLLHWVIIGGESGPGARPCNVEWIRSIVRQCKDAKVAVFVKQLGANYCDAANGIGGAATKQPDNIPPIRRLADKKGADPSEWPADLRVRQLPEVTRA